MSSQSQELHFVLFPFMAQGHMIPMIDIAKMLAQHGVIITIFTTPINFKRFATTLASTSHQIRIVQLKFPTQEAGLPEDCENFDMLPSLGLSQKFMSAAQLLEDEAEHMFQDLKPKPNCIISDMCLPFTSNISSKFGVPRISFMGFSTFSTMCLQYIGSCQAVLNYIMGSESGAFTVPGLPDRVEFTSKTWPGAGVNFVGKPEKIMDAEKLNYGFIVNSFEELETGYVELLKKEKGETKVWWIGPVSLCNKDHHLDKIERGNKSSIDKNEIFSWLNLQQSASVIYICLGSICNLVTAQLIELGLGLEASRKQFIWVIRSGEISKQIEEWVVESGFEERTKNRGIVIRGWAPQVSILSHSAVGAFLTHCGWNSTLEAISVGLPMVTWPLFGDQFGNEKLVVEILKIGVGVGVDCCMSWGKEEESRVSVRKESIENAVNMVIDGGEEGEKRRARAKEFSEMAKRAIEVGGSSYVNMKRLIEDIKQLSFNGN